MENERGNNILRDASWDLYIFNVGDEPSKGAYLPLVSGDKREYSFSNWMTSA